MTLQRFVCFKNVTIHVHNQDVHLIIMEIEKVLHAKNMLNFELKRLLFHHLMLPLAVVITPTLITQ